MAALMFFGVPHAFARPVLPPVLTLGTTGALNATQTLSSPIPITLSWDETITESPLPSALDTSKIHVISGGTYDSVHGIMSGVGYYFNVIPNLPQGATSVHVTVSVDAGFVHNTLGAPSATSTFGIDYLPAPQEVWVSWTYSGDGAGGHVWGYDAFKDIQSGIDMVAASGTVHVLAGHYAVSRNLSISKPLHLSGPGRDAREGQTATIENDECNTAITVSDAADVTISGFFIKQTDGDVYCYESPVVRVSSNTISTRLDGNDIAGGYVGVALRYDSASSTVINNHIHNNEWAGVVMQSSGAHLIDGNILQFNGWGLAMGCGPDGCADPDISGTTVSNNTIVNNSSGGIYYGASNQISTVSIGPNNAIYLNNDGIVIRGDDGNLKIFGNSIYNNIAVDSGLHVDENTGLVDAAQNWWGDSSGPTIETNPSGAGETITNMSSSTNLLFFRPYCMDEACHTLSTITVTPPALTSLFNVGTFTLPADADVHDTSHVVVAEGLTIVVGAVPGTSTVYLPPGTVISRTDGQSMDASAITASDVLESVLSGLGNGKVVEGAMQWGIPHLGLTFSTPITLRIFVGNDFNGQTLYIQRSLATDSGWTNDGIVAPGSCLVTDGYCSFQTTKASYYAVTTAGNSSSGGGGGGGYVYRTSAVTNGSLKINDGAPKTNSPLVKLTLTANNADLMAIANTSDFAGTSWEKFSTAHDWILSGGDGDKTVYAKFRDANGNATGVYTASIRYEGSQQTSGGGAATGGQAGGSGISIFIFTKTLRPGMRGNDVTELQKRLIALHLLKGSPTGYYGPQTTAAVKAYQRLMKIKPVTGIVGPLTIKALNK